jgi:diaminopimelate epimerase
VRFEKWQALGNDYVIVEAEDLPWDLTPERIRRICERHTGIGSDGILLLSRVEDDRYVADLRIFNPDGSEAELSGNGAREAVLYLRRSGWTDEDEFAILMRAGEIRPTITGPDSATIAMGRASVASPEYPSGGQDGTGTVVSGGREWSFQHVSIGNPQCVIDVGDEIEDLDLAELGPPISSSELFPNRTNVSFIRIDGASVRARIFERGVGETLSSGTGAGGAGVAAFLRGAPSPIAVRLDGGELTVEIDDELDVRLTGTASPVYRGELADELASELAALG